MRVRLPKPIWWLLRKTIFSAIVISLGLTAYALHLFVVDPFDFESNREKRIRDLAAQKAQLVSEGEVQDAAIESIRDEIHKERDRASRAANVIQNLRSQQSRWQRWFGDAQHQRDIDARLAHVTQIETEARQKVLTLQRDATRKDWERDGVQIELEKVQGQLRLLEHARSPSLHYLRTAWRQTKWFAVAFVVLYFFGGFLLRAIMFYAVAPFFVRGKSLQFAENSLPFPPVAKASASLDVPLWPGEILSARRGFVQSSDMGLTDRRRLLQDWRFPFTSWLSGLHGLREIQHGHARGEQRVTLGAPGEKDAEFSLIQIPDGGSLVVRPRAVAATIQPPAQKQRWKSRWRVFSRSAWGAGQWRFIEIYGPCRVVLYGPPPARVEIMEPNEAGARPSRRIRGRAILGFSSDVQYARVRTPSFWRYVRGHRQLLDALFVGPGLLICHETPRRRGGRLSRAWSGMLHAFGL